MNLYIGTVTDNFSSGVADGMVMVNIDEKDAGNGEGTACTVAGSTAFGLNANVGISSILKNNTRVYVLEDQKGNHVVIGTVPGENNTDDLNQGDGGKKIETVGGGTPFTQHVHPELCSEATHDKVQIIRTESGHMIRLCDTQGQEEVDITHKSGSYIKFLADGTVKIYAKNNLEIDVENNMITYVMGNQLTEVRKNRYNTVKQNEDKVVEQSRTKYIKGNEENKIDGYQDKTVGSRINQTSYGVTTLKESELQVITEMSKFSGAVNAQNNIVSSADCKSSGGAVTLNGHTHGIINHIITTVGNG